MKSIDNSNLPKNQDKVKENKKFTMEQLAVAVHYKLNGNDWYVKRNVEEGIITYEELQKSITSRTNFQ